jgi:hypothetical protein
MLLNQIFIFIMLIIIFLKKKPSIYHVFKPGTREGINTQAYISCFPVTRQHLSIGSTIRQKAGWFHCDGD